MTEEKNEQTAEVGDVATHENVVTTSTGVSLLCKQVPPWLYMAKLSQIDVPEAPILKDRNFPGWEQEDTDSEVYKAKSTRYQMMMGKSMYDIWVVFGTELVGELPKGMEGHLDKNPKWLDRVKFVLEEVHPEDENWRYLAWVMTVAAPTDDDMALILEVVQGLSGVTEKEVEKARKFPGRK